MEKNKLIDLCIKKTMQSRVRIGILICLQCMMFSLTAHSQTQKMSYNKNNVTIKEVLSAIKLQTSLLTVYSPGDINPDSLVSVNVINRPVTEVLNTILAGSNVTYVFRDNYIVLSRKIMKLKISKQVKGVVKDVSGSPMIGVTVIVLGTSHGTTTAIDGSFSISMKHGEQLNFSHLGYQTKTLTVEKESIDVVLQDEINVMDKVVVTALGIKRSEKALSYNVQTVDNEDIVKNKDANFVNALSGKVAGVNINASSSGVGGASKVVMRGTKAIDQSSNALYVVDGVPMYNLGGSGGTEFASAGTSEPIADINPEDIESVSVLTGAAASALYGSHGSNGAIVITTKKGGKTKLQSTFSSNTELLSPFVMPIFQNRYGTGDLTSGKPVRDKSWGTRLYRDGTYLPQDNFMQNGVVATNTLSMSVGNDKNQTYISLGSVNSRGIIPNNKYDRYNFSFRNTTTFIDDRMTLDLSGNYIKQKDRNMVNQGIYSNPLVSAYLFPRGDDFNTIKIFERYDVGRKISTQYWPQGAGEFRMQNPYWIAYRNLRNNDKSRYMFTANASYKLLDWLTVSARARIDNSVNEFVEKFYASTDETIAKGPKGLYGTVVTREQQLYTDFLVSINKTLNDFSINANIGAVYSDIRSDALGKRGTIRENGIPNVFNIHNVDNTTSKDIQNGWREQTQSVFASADFGYKSTYYLTLTGRNDWPSQLAGPKSVQKSFFYPSVGGSIVVSEMMRLPLQISYMKLRGSFASVGLPVARHLSSPTYKWDDTNNLWVSKTHYPFYEFKPERTNSWEIGMTTRFFKHFNLDATFYNTKTYNQTFDPQISVSSGYSTLYIQTGAVRNRGVELALNYKNNWNGFGWDTGLTASSNHNEILELVDNFVHPETGETITKSRLDVGGLNSARFILKKGGTLGDIYSTSDLKKDSQGNIYVDAAGNIARKTGVDDIKLGSVFPKCNLAWRNSFNYKNFDFAFMISARIGGVVYSATQAAMDFYGVSETSAIARDNGGVLINRKDVVPADLWYSTIGSQNGLPQYYTYSATNVRLQEASIGYTIPRRKLGDIMDITISLVGRNLFMFYNKAPFDPESVASTGNYYQGLDYFMMPSMRSVGFNLRIKF